MADHQLLVVADEQIQIKETKTPRRRLMKDMSKRMASVRNLIGKKGGLIQLDISQKEENKRNFPSSCSSTSKDFTAALIRTSLLNSSNDTMTEAEKPARLADNLEDIYDRIEPFDPQRVIQFDPFRMELMEELSKAQHKSSGRRKHSASSTTTTSSRKPLKNASHIKSGSTNKDKKKPISKPDNDTKKMPLDNKHQGGKSDSHHSQKSETEAETDVSSSDEPDNTNISEAKHPSNSGRLARRGSSSRPAVKPSKTGRTSSRQSSSRHLLQRLCKSQRNLSASNHHNRSPTRSRKEDELGSSEPCNGIRRARLDVDMDAREILHRRLIKAKSCREVYLAAWGHRFHKER